MYHRTKYEMTQEDLDALFEAMRPVPMIALHIGGHRSQQEHANDAWAALGQKMGFDPMTVQPSGDGDRFFTAIPSETPQHKEARLKKEAEEKKQAEIAKLNSEMDRMSKRLAELEN